MPRYPHWRYRRAIIFLTLIFCASCIVFVMVRGGDSRVDETIVVSAFGLAGAVIASWVFGAVWEDNTTRSAASWEDAPDLGAPPPGWPNAPSDPRSGAGTGG